MTHGHAPRVRNQTEEEREQGPVIQINSEALINKTFDAALTAGVSLAVAQILKD